MKLLISALVICSILLGGIIGHLFEPPTLPTRVIQEVIVYQNVTDYDVCLELVKDTDLFQRNLYEKEWLK